MTGKVFKESNNIYQDQAKVLFDYYKNAAEKIVSEEIAEEQNKSDLTAQIDQENETITSCTKKFKIFLIVGIVLAVIGLFGIIILTIAGLGVAGYAVSLMLKANKSKARVAELQDLMDKVDAKYRNIRRDYSMNKIGVAYVPVATRVPFEGKSFLVDHTNSVSDSEFKLNVLHQPEEFQESVKNLYQSMDSMPLVEDNEGSEEVNTSEYSTSVQSVTLHDYVGNIDRQVRNISYLLKDSDQISVSLPVIEPNSVESNNIAEYTTSEIGDKPVVKVFDVDYTDRVEQFTSMNGLKDQFDNGGDQDNTESLKKMMAQLAESVQLLSVTKNSGSSKLINYTSGILSNVLKASYNQYSPSLEADEIEKIRTTDFNYQTSVNDYTPFELKQSSRVKYDMYSNNWVAEDGSRTNLPFGMHQVDEEVLMPVITALMEENRVERLNIYNNIEDQKREYLEKWSSETGNYFRDNRKSADELITHMREAYADYVSAYNMYQSLQDTSASMKASGSLEDTEVNEIDAQAEMIAGFEAQANQCNEQQEAFAGFMDRIQENISSSRDEFAHIEYYEGSLRDASQHDMAVAMSEIHGLEDRRKQLVGINPYIAKYAELPPEPRTNPEMMEHATINLLQKVAENVEDIDSQKQQLNASNLE